MTCAPKAAGTALNKVRGGADPSSQEGSQQELPPLFLEEGGQARV